MKNLSNQGVFFSILADEGRDISNQEQLVILLRYFDSEIGSVLDRLLTMKSVANTDH